MSTTPLLEARGLTKHFPIRGAGLFAAKKGDLRAVADVSIKLYPGKTFAVVGESGCGKTTLARMLALLHRPTGGELRFEGELMSPNKRRDINALRRNIQMIFQDPYSALNPRMTVSAIISEPLRIHRRTGRAERVAALMDAVGLASSLGNRYPHEFSGGQRQRISIARALATRPRFLICDEPTSALDVSIQAQILNLLKDLQEALGLTMLFISHDLPVIRQMCDRVGVMRYGELCEIAETETMFESPSHEYTQHLLALMPKLDLLSTRALDDLVDTSVTP